MNKIFQSQLINSLPMKKLKISGATESKNDRNMDQVQHPENGTNLDLDIDIDIDLQNENDFFEDLYYANTRSNAN
jgi:hypothetical protein